MSRLTRSKRSAPEKTRSRSSRVVEDLDPHSGWAEDQDNHRLLIDLPNFKEEEIKIGTERSDEVTISGERRVKDDKFVRFVKTYKVPKDGDTQRTSRKLEGRLLTVTIPKRQMAEKKDYQAGAEIESTGNDFDDDAPHENLTRTETKEPRENLTRTETEEPRENLTRTETEEPEKNLTRTETEEPGANLTRTETKEPEANLTRTKTEEPEENLTRTKTEEPEANLTRTETEEPEANLTRTETEEPEANLTRTETEEPEENLTRTETKEPEANLTRTETEEAEEEEGGVGQNEKESCCQSSNLFCRGIEMISKNRMTIFMAILAFSLGAFSSRKFGWSS